MTGTEYRLLKTVITPNKTNTLRERKNMRVRDSSKRLKNIAFSVLENSRARTELMKDCREVKFSLAEIS
jgi:hypothetical protein